MQGDVSNMKYEFTAEGLRLTSEGADAEYVIDYSLASPQLVLDHYESITITYKVENSSTSALRVALGGSDESPTAQSSRAKSVTLVADGEVHTVTIELKVLRVTKNSLKELGLYFDQKSGAGESILIQSIQFNEKTE